MIVYYPEKHYKHAGFELYNGEKTQSSENPIRVERIKSTLENHGGFTFKTPALCNKKLILQTHESSYIEYLVNGNWEETAFPSVWNYTDKRQVPIHAISQKGYFVFDTYTPLTKNLWEVVLESASCAVSAADSLAFEPTSYALCRPPGHHATKSMAGGYCYVNNAAVAANHLLNKGAKRIAILDIDFHHSNGTQDIFYNSRHVLTVSIHADPARKFPYYSGYEDEKGIGEGFGYNINYPLDKGVDDEKYLEVLSKALLQINQYKPEILIICAGFDTYKKDPICDFSLTIKGFERIGKLISKLHIPTLVVQEGGYNLEDLGNCALSFLKPFLR